MNPRILRWLHAYEERCNRNELQKLLDDREELDRRIALVRRSLAREGTE